MTTTYQQESNSSYKGWIKGCLIALVTTPLFLVLVVILFYAEENWRGAHAWAKAKAEIEAQGETLDPTKFIPAVVPEAENFGALPFFDEVPDPASKDSTRLSLSLTIKDVTDHMPSSLDEGAKPDSLPYLGNGQKREVLIADVVQKRLLVFLHRDKPGTPVPANAKPSDTFLLICPSIAELRAANATHALCRFNRDYANQHPWNIKFGAMTGQIKVAQLLAYDERLALLSREPTLALEDFRVALKINSGLRQDALVVSGLVSVAVVAIQLTVINQGLADHAWDDQQLAGLDEEMGKIVCLHDGLFCLRGETARFSIPMIDFYSSHRSKWIKDTVSMNSLFGNDSAWRDLGMNATYWLIPQGWFEKIKANGIQKLLYVTQAVSPDFRRIYPERVEKAPPGDSDVGPRWMNFMTQSMGPLQNSLKNFSYLQVQLDEARISCRLERYCLAHGHYPPTLDALVPEYGAELPRDIMNGEAYTYKLNPDETYLLYSVGWDLKDDGGNAGTTRTKDSPDWIWTNYSNQKPSK